VHTGRLERRFPGGFSAPTATAPLGVPVRAELFGRELSERLLLSLAYSFEQAAIMLANSRTSSARNAAPSAKVTAAKT
jgi:Asp-tRNA(Asn)/Glu-tRNA(Gln) amidotransferase A subunit family amidase